MNILDVVLRRAPMEWDETSYTDYENVRYKLYDVSIGDREYQAEVNAFVNGEPRIEVQSIKRIQNPYQLGRFMIRTEQKKFRGENVEVVKYYHPLRSVDLDTALEYNMDVRRYAAQQPGQVDSKTPKFYKTPGKAYYAMSSCELILVCSVLGSGADGSTTSKTCDAEYMPNYVVKVNAA